MGSRNVKARMLYWKISLDQRVNHCSGPWPMLLYSWLIPCQDNLGRLEGEAEVIRGMIFPLQTKMTVDRIERYLQELHDHGLIFRYRLDQVAYLQFPVTSIEKLQKIVGNMTEESDFPNPPPDEYLVWIKDVRMCTNTYERVQISTLKGREGNRREGNGTPEGFERTVSDQTFVQAMQKAYPLLSLGREFDKMRAWLAANPRKAQKKDWPRFIQGWLNRATPEAKTDARSLSPTARLQLDRERAARASGAGVGGDSTGMDARRPGAGATA